MPDRRIEMTFTARADQVGAVRRAIRSFLASWQASRLTGDAELLGTELASNAIVHAGGGSFGFAIEIDGGQVRIEIRDESPEFPALRRADPDAESGRGILLVSALAKEWGVGVDGGAKTTWCVLGT